jgi:hypothetical protein
MQENRAQCLVADARKQTDKRTKCGLNKMHILIGKDSK